MNEARYASLSSGLLARKGAAKPAMRPQGFTPIEDLGWNDMGYAPQVEEQPEPEMVEHVPSSISALTPAPKPFRAEVEPLPVVAQQRAIAESFDVEEGEPAPAEQPSPKKAGSPVRRAWTKMAPGLVGCTSAGSVSPSMVRSTRLGWAGTSMSQRSWCTVR